VVKLLLFSFTWNQQQIIQSHTFRLNFISNYFLYYWAVFCTENVFKNFKFFLFGNPKFNLDWILFQIIFYIIDLGSV
jgi:hypothetical protein